MGRAVTAAWVAGALQLAASLTVPFGGLTKPTRKSALEHVLVAKAALLLASAGVVALLSVLSFHGWKPLGNLSV